MHFPFSIFNGVIKSSNLLPPIHTDSKVIYEVLRVIDGVPLFFEDHYNRMEHSCRSIGLACPVTEHLLKQDIVLLCESNNITDGNVRIRLFISVENPLSVTEFIPHSYPTDEDYLKGVITGLLHAERNNPSAKIEQDIRVLANQALKNGGFYEVLLVDKEGNITEGSRSNLVFIKNEALYTCPLDKVLTGITLMKVLQIAKNENIPVIYKAIKETNIMQYESLFITGTSPKILPVFKAEETTFNVQNPLITILQQKYNKIIADYINDNKV
jgi:branched-chain amino acid aminotransferase